jgi:hypothetical protein
LSSSLVDLVSGIPTLRPPIVRPRVPDVPHIGCRFLDFQAKPVGRSVPLVPSSGFLDINSCTLDRDTSMLDSFWHPLSISRLATSLSWKYGLIFHCASDRGAEHSISLNSSGLGIIPLPGPFILLSFLYSFVANFFCLYQKVSRVYQGQDLDIDPCHF